MAFEGRDLSIRHLSRLFRKSGSTEVVSTEPNDYIFPYEDRELHAKARGALSFVSNGTAGSEEKHMLDPQFDRPHALDFSPAFEYTGDDSLVSKCEVSSQYRTIFTYSETTDIGAHLIDDRTSLYRHLDDHSGVALFLRVLSMAFFALFFPFVCWIFIKRLSEHERLIVFRLGRRLKPKGPGFVFILPFCDQYHSVRLDDQTLKLNPVCGSTSDDSLVEVHFDIVFRLVDPNCAYMTAKDAPSRLVTNQAQLCILSSLKRFNWQQLNDCIVRGELALDAMVNLNCHCNVHGIQVSRINIMDVRLLRPPAPSETTRTLQQLRMISSALFPQAPNISVPPLSALNSNLSNVHTNHAMQPNVSTAESTNNMDVDTPALNTVVPTTLHHEDLAESKASGHFNEDVCQRVISRVRVFLSNPLVQIVFGRSTLQLVVSSKTFVPPLPSLTEVRESNCYTLAYMDTKRGIATMGQLPLEITPDAILYISATTLSDILNGRVDLNHAIQNQMVFVTGNTAAFDKFQRLLCPHIT